MKVNVLLIGAAMAAMAGCASAAEPEPNAVFGVLSDIHLVPTDVRSVERFKKTLLNGKTAGARPLPRSLAADRAEVDSKSNNGVH